MSGSFSAFIVLYACVFYYVLEVVPDSDYLVLDRKQESLSFGVYVSYF